LEQDSIDILVELGMEYQGKLRMTMSPMTGVVPKTPKPLLDKELLIVYLFEMQAQSHKFCENCGVPLLPADQFCGSCGFKLPV
jgi:hypothetical protein